MAGNLKELFEDTVASQLKVWDDEIEHLDARADILMAQFEDRFYDMIRSLRTKERELKTQLEQLKAASGGDEGWIAAKDRMMRTANDMKAAIECAEEEIVSR